ncbi:MAG: nucleotidyltransferase domain-containing protein [Armatimonadetes bacterium]|nr:nucleotidyltransferase domain-containing protein [Armatimonadota bacterium]
MSTLGFSAKERSEIHALCREYAVRLLELFGSAADGKFDPSKSDLDFLVEFGKSDKHGPTDQYFGLLFALEELFGRKVDLVSRRAIRNPYFLEAVNETKVFVYAA